MSIVTMPMIGSDVVWPNALADMRKQPDVQWWAYQNLVLGAPLYLEIQYLACGNDCTFATPPPRMPPHRGSNNEGFYLIGRVNLAHGRINTAI